jgi:predicted transcriptional regulator
MITPIGTLGMQTSRNFPIARKLGKTHQNVLVFVKGDGKKATQACGDVFIHIPEGDDSEDPAYDDSIG